MDDIFQAVPGHNDYRYLTTKRIVDLGLKGLFYNVKVLLVRKGFQVAYKNLEDYKAISSSSSIGGVVVTGQPGIGEYLLPTADSITDNCYSHNLGKTCFIHYLLLRLLCEKKTVAFQVNNHFLLFQDTGVEFARDCSDKADAGTFIPPGTWALTDSHAKYVLPCEAFQAASTLGHAWIVQTTLPSLNNWNPWLKTLSPFMYMMDVFSLDELSVLGYV